MHVNENYCEYARIYQEDRFTYLPNIYSYLLLACFSELKLIWKHWFSKPGSTGWLCSLFNYTPLQLNGKFPVWHQRPWECLHRKKKKKKKRHSQHISDCFSFSQCWLTGVKVSCFKMISWHSCLIAHPSRGQVSVMSTGMSTVFAVSGISFHYLVLSFPSGNIFALCVLVCTRLIASQTEQQRYIESQTFV